MSKNFHDVLLEILAIIHYPRNKAKFVVEFEEMNHLETVVNLLEKLPLEMQERIKAGERNEEMVKKYIPDEIYISELTNVSSKALVKLIEAVSPLLKLEQKQKVVQLLQ